MAVRGAGRRTGTGTYGERGMRVETCMPLLHVLTDAKKLLRQRKKRHGWTTEPDRTLVACGTYEWLHKFADIRDKGVKRYRMRQKGQTKQEQMLVGIDVGSTTTKVVVMHMCRTNCMRD